MRREFFLGVIFISIINFSCGGGGGGESPIPHLAYVGKTEQAKIDSTNAVDLSVGAFIGGDSISDFGISNSLDVNQSNTIKEIKLYEVTKILSESVYRMEIYDNSDNTATVQRQEDSFSGPCGGSVSYVVNVDDVSGAFTGSMTFLDYCNENKTISGKADFSGLIDLNSGNFLNFNLTINMIDLISDSQDYTLDGKMSVELSDTISTESLNMLMQNDHSKEVYWIDNYSIILSEGSDYVDLSVSGRFYDPGQGYVDLSTINPIRAYQIYLWPSSGALEIAGRDETRARLVVDDENFYHVIADTDGDGEFDYNSDQLSWDSGFETT